MNLSLYIARRYFFSGRRSNASNIITGISVLGFTVGSMALIIVLSAFNGFEVLVDSLYHSFYPDIKITPRYGKVFEPDSSKLARVHSLPGVWHASSILEENVLLKYDNKQHIATIKGVNEEYPRMVHLDSLVVEGKPVLQQRGYNFAIAGSGVAYKLSLNPYNDLVPLHVYVPRRGADPLLHPEQSFNQLSIIPSGIFVLEESIDNKYVFVPIRFARELLRYPTQISSYEVSLRDEKQMLQVQEEIKKIMGDGFEVKNRFEQNAVLYRIMRSEKTAVFLILTFILLIAAFNVTGSLYMLVIEKKEDIKVMRAMGADKGLVRNIFLTEGLLVTLSGSVIGILLGGVFCWGQQTFGWVKIGNNANLLMDSYPVKMYATDFVLVFLTSMLIGIITSWYPAARAAASARGKA